MKSLINCENPLGYDLLFAFSKDRILKKRAITNKVIKIVAIPKPRRRK